MSSKIITTPLECRIKTSQLNRVLKKAKVTTTGVTRSVKVTHPLNTKYTWFDPNERISGHCVTNQTMVCPQFPTVRTRLGAVAAAAAAAAAVAVAAAAAAAAASAAAAAAVVVAVAVTAAAAAAVAAATAAVAFNISATRWKLGTHDKPSFAAVRNLM